MHLIGIDQELRAILIHREAKMIGNRFVHVQAGRPLKGRRQVGPLSPMFDIRATHDQSANAGFVRPVGMTS